jgi:UDP:flavonoid glycosyltransferase YjiC (YdhE family)
MSYSFLMASWGSSGNLNPLLTGRRQLRRNGHRVRVIADPAMREEVEAAGFPFLTWRRAPTGTEADPTDFSDSRAWIRKVTFDPAAAYAADILDEICQAPTDAILSIDVLFGAVISAEAAGVPIAMLSPHVSVRPLPGVPPPQSLDGPVVSRYRELADFAKASAAAVAILTSLSLFSPATPTAPTT